MAKGQSLDRTLQRKPYNKKGNNNVKETTKHPRHFEQTYSVFA